VIPHLSSITLADADGDSYLLLRLGNEWKSRISRPKTWGKRALWREWTVTDSTRKESWREIDYDARRRPWYKNAVAEIRKKGAHAPIRQLVYWTRPYEFFTTKRPGMSASTAIETPDNKLFILGLDIVLEAVSQYTTKLRVGESGMVFVLAGEPGEKDSAVIGLPSDPRFKEKVDMQKYILRPPQDIGGRWRISSHMYRKQDNRIKVRRSNFTATAINGGEWRVAGRFWQNAPYGSVWSYHKKTY
jgi:two-component system, sensor histidine kinase and response regulator